MSPSTTPPSPRTAPMAFSFTTTGHVTDFRIENSHLGEIRDSNGNLVHAGNDGNGLHVTGGTIAPQSGVAGSFGLTIEDSDINLNGLNGILIEGGAMVRDLTVTMSSTRTSISGNSLNGIVILASTVTDADIDNTTIQDNGVDGIHAEGSTLSAILIGAETRIWTNKNDGLHVIGGTIAPESDVRGSFGLLIDSATILSNALNGADFDAVNAKDVTFKNTVLTNNIGTSDSFD